MTRRIALVHDHLGQDGGAERVLAVLQEMYPSAPTFTLVHNPDRANPAFLKRDIRTSFLQRLPFAKRHYQWYLGLMPNAVERYDLTDFDLVISNSASFARGVITRPETLHIDYCHSPTRYLWSDTHRYVDELHYPGLVKTFVPFMLTKLRQWDRLAADRVDEFFANSRAVQQRITKYYRRPSVIMHPPVDVEDFQVSPSVGDYYLIGGRLVSYKRYDLAVRAFNRLGLKLKIFGSGPEEAPLRAMAKPNIEFLGKVSRSQLAELYARSIAFLHPQEEDFGITALEANAAGRPVIAYAAGGALETVVPGLSGTFFADQEWETLADTIIRFQPETYQPEKIRQHAATFSTAQFQKRFSSAVDAAWEHYRHSSESGRERKGKNYGTS